MTIEKCLIGLRAESVVMDYFLHRNRFDKPTFPDRTSLNWVRGKKPENKHSSITVYPLRLKTLKRYIIKFMDEWMDALLDGWMDVWIDGWISGWVEWMF